MTTAANPDPWERQPNETPQAYEGFATYRDQGRDRSVRRAAQALDKSVTVIGEWSSLHGWVRRVAAYDRHLDEQRRRTREDAILDMERRHATQLAGAAGALVQPIQAFLQRIQVDRAAGIDPFKDLTTAQLARLAQMSVRHLGSVVEAERLVAGLSTESHADAPATHEAARLAAERMGRSELEDYLLGVDDGRAAIMVELGLDPELAQPNTTTEEVTQ